VSLPDPIGATPGCSASRDSPSWSLDKLQDPEFWRELNPALSVTEHLDPGQREPLDPGARESAEYVTRMQTEGYFSTRPLLNKDRMAAMAGGAANILEAGGHELWTLVYDEFWLTLKEISSVLDPILGKDHRIVPMPYVNFINPGTENAGFGVHRDRFDHPVTPNGLPTVVTAWIALTDATPDRACLYVLPASFDPNFPNNLRELAVNNLQDIRAVPVEAGSVICFNQAIMHWGGRSSPRAEGPRISFAFEFERANIALPREPTLNLDRTLSLEARLGFIGTVILMLSKNNIQFSRETLKSAAALSSVVYNNQFASYF